MASNCCDTNGFELYYRCSIERPFIGESPWDGPPPISGGLSSAGRYLLWEAFYGTRTKPYISLSLGLDPDTGEEDYIQPELQGCLIDECRADGVGASGFGCPQQLPWFAVSYDETFNFVHGVFDFYACGVDGFTPEPACTALLAHVTGTFGCGLLIDPQNQPYSCGYIDGDGNPLPNPGIGECAGACLHNDEVCKPAPAPDTGCFCAKGPNLSCALPPEVCGFGPPNCASPTN
jgi:hypothetical protein